MWLYYTARGFNSRRVHHFMKGYVIRISNHNFSAKLAEEAYQSCKKFDIDTEYFGAVVPSTLNKFFLDYNVTMASQFMAKKASELPTQACFASHYCLWKRCIDINEKILILEHDGVLLSSVENILGEIQDVCHLDPNRAYSKDYDDKIKRTIPNGVVDFGNSNKATSDREFTGQHFAGAYAYIITPSGANKIVNFVQQYGAWEADRLIGEKILRLQITDGSYARLNEFFKSIEDIRKYSTRTNPHFIY